MRTGSQSDITSDFRFLESDSEAIDDFSALGRGVTRQKATSPLAYLRSALQATLWCTDRLVQVMLAVAIPQLPNEDEVDEAVEKPPESPSWDLDMLPLAGPLLALVLLGFVPASKQTLAAASCTALLSLTLRFTWPGLMPRVRATAGAALVPAIFFLSILWMNSIAEELVALLETMGIVGALPSTVLGVTVLAWGNSVGDMVSNCAVARSGKPKMALAAIYAGPVFNALVGISLSMLLETLRVGSTHVVWRGHGNEIVLLGGSILFGQFRALLWPVICGWELRRTLAKGLLFNYSLFTLAMVLLATGVVPRDCWTEFFCS